MRITPIHYPPQVRIHRHQVTAPTALNFRVMVEREMAKDANKEPLQSAVSVAA